MIIIYKNGPHNNDIVGVRALINNHPNITWLISTPKLKNKYIDNKEPSFDMELAQFCMSISIRMLVAIISNPDYNGKRSFHDLWMDPDTRAIVNDYRVSYKSSNKDSAVTLKGDYTESDPLIFTKLKAVEKTVIQD